MLATHPCLRRKYIRKRKINGAYAAGDVEENTLSAGINGLEEQGGFHIYFTSYTA